jgi:hypothetical protein
MAESLSFPAIDGARGQVHRAERIKAPSIRTIAPVLFGGFAPCARGKTLGLFYTSHQPVAFPLPRREMGSAALLQALDLNGID